MVATKTIQYSHTVGTLFFPRESPGFTVPVDTALGRGGILWVLNRAGVPSFVTARRITKCTCEGKWLGISPFGGTGKGDDRMIWPVSMVVDRDGNIYISDEALHRISVLDSEGNFLRNWGVKGAGNGEFNRPAGIAFDNDDNLMVVDGLNHRVQRYTRDGHFLGAWGRFGSGDGEFRNPWGVTVDSAGDVYVADWRNDRIQKFEPDGTHLATLGTPGGGDGELHRPAGIAVDGDGDIWVADWGNERVQVLDSDGRFVAKLRGEATLSIMSTDYYYEGFHHQLEADLEAQRNMLEDPPTFDSPRNESASIEKYFWAPTSVRIGDDGMIYIADSHRHRIQVYRKGG